MLYLVSACLAGKPCRYDGKSNTDPRIVKLVQDGKAFPVCPEEMGGLSTPREPCEIARNTQTVISCTGNDCTRAFIEGSQKALCVGKDNGCSGAILKARSPSCGVGLVHDGSFTRTLVPRNGIFAELVKKEGWVLYSEEDWPGDSL